jgi:hypothetical protein
MKKTQDAGRALQAASRWMPGTSIADEKEEHRQQQTQSLKQYKKKYERKEHNHNSRDSTARVKVNNDRFAEPWQTLTLRRKI